MTGYTSSSRLPHHPGAFDTTYNGVLDAFVTKLNASGSALAYSTFLGGTSVDVGVGIAVDGDGQCLRDGEHRPPSDFPTTPGAFDTTFNGSR